MATTINQPSKNPTNKLSAATIAAAAVSVLGLALRNWAPGWYDPDVMAAMLPVIVYATGWLVPDNPNIIVITQDQEPK
jgi:hypothetical protein